MPFPCRLPLDNCGYLFFVRQRINEGGSGEAGREGGKGEERGEERGS